MADNENNENKKLDKPDKQSSDNQALENKSLEELHKQIEKGKRKASRSFVFAIAALIAIVAIGVAWFVANTKVTAIGARISAENSVNFELGSIGTRSTDEEKKLVEAGGSDGTGNVPILSGGTQNTYQQYIDANVKTKIEKVTQANIELQTGSSNLAWYLNDTTNFWPGASGHLEFYIIPKQSSFDHVTIQIQMEAYTDNFGIAKKIENDNAGTLNGLLSGHILWFRGLSDEKGYSDWVEVSDDGTLSITINASDLGQEKLMANMPYKVTLYWIWPKYFRNYIYGSRNSFGDLFTDVSEANTDHTDLLAFINRDNNANMAKLFVGTQTGDSTTDIKQDMSDTTLDKWSGYYDQADEYIGNNVKYVYVNATVVE